MWTDYTGVFPLVSRCSPAGRPPVAGRSLPAGRQDEADDDQAEADRHVPQADAADRVVGLGDVVHDHPQQADDEAGDHEGGEPAGAADAYRVGALLGRGEREAAADAGLGHRTSLFLAGGGSGGRRPGRHRGRHQRRRSFVG